jgi:hypothetical protein
VIASIDYAKQDAVRERLFQRHWGMIIRKAAESARFMPFANR